jgi:hypothetical protein
MDKQVRMRRAGCGVQNQLTCCAMAAADMLSRTEFPSTVLFMNRMLMPLSSNTVATSATRPRISCREGTQQQSIKQSTVLASSTATKLHLQRGACKADACLSRQQGSAGSNLEVVDALAVLLKCHRPRVVCVSAADGRDYFCIELLAVCLHRHSTLQHNWQVC